MKACICQVCGGTLRILEGSDRYSTRYGCRYCGTQYEESKVEQYRDYIERLFDERKQEQLGALKQLLYEEVHTKKYADSARILEICRDIRKIMPEDFLATFFEAVNLGEEEEVCRLLASFDVKEHAYAVDTILDFMLRSVTEAYLIPLNYLIDLAYKDVDLERYEHYATRLSQETEKLLADVYTLTTPRDVFVCYSSKDMPEVIALVRYLEEEGLTCFVAARNLKHGVGAVQNYDAAIKTAIDYCKVVLFVSSDNSRKHSCDAMHIELPYIRRKDTDSAPAEYRYCYDKMPPVYKMPRVEYLLKPYKNSPTERTAREFFAGNEWCYTPENVLERIIDILNDGWVPVAPPPEAPRQAPNDTKKYCGYCFTENEPDAKFCKNCGKGDFADSLAEAGNLFRRLAQEDAARKAREEALRTAQEEAARLAAEQAQNAVEEARRAQEEAERLAAEQTQKAAEQARKAENARRVKEEAERKAKEAKVWQEKGNLKRDGEYVFFGTYPQTKVKDAKIISALNDEAGTLPTAGKSGKWTSYGYYAKGKVSNYMWYIDLTHSGTQYRGVYFTAYRPFWTIDSGSASNSFQDNNGYTPDNVYWFKFEPIKWRILSENNGEALILAEMAIDNHEYYHQNRKDSFSHNGGTGYANNYALSNIRKWLNDNFYNTAFSDMQKRLIVLTKVDNSARSTNPNGNATLWDSGKNTYACADTQDYVFLLSEQEVTNAAYGFSSIHNDNDRARIKKNTDYIRCQGAWTDNEKSYRGNGYWLLRSSISDGGNRIRYVYSNGDTDRVNNVYSVGGGVVPALKIKLS